jgi:diguanylate cyclase (GGDEF)-like protein
MERVLAGLHQRHHYAYMYLIDLDHFKTINDSLGHDIGDKLLQEVSARIENFSKGTHTVARIGGDEFAMVSHVLTSKERCMKESASFADKLLEVIKRPYVIEGHHLYLSASVGISYIDPQFHDRDASIYMREADIAMYEVKSQGRDGIVQFDDLLSTRIERDLRIEKKLYFALMNHRIVLTYQPLFGTEERIGGCEVLSRWRDEDLGEISPEIFVGIAEKTGLIIELGNYILSEAFKTLREWEERGHYCEHFAINISARQLVDSGFVADVKHAINQYLPERWKSTVYFEITESILVEDIPKAIDVMGELKRLGIHFAMDDFGTGYSSLSYLRELPIDELKIDGSFIHHLDSSREDETMVETILSIAKTFGLKVVAEGVETKAQYDFLLQHGCDYFQGFYFDRALNREVFERKYITH